VIYLRVCNFPALKKHPDTASASVTNAAAEFSLISNAWAVLSKPDLKRQYDSARKSYISPNTFTTKTSTTEANIVVDHKDRNERGSDPTVISETFHVQRAAYGRTKDTDNESWEGKRGKYYHEKWRKLPLDQKKVPNYFLILTLLLVCFHQQLQRSKEMYRAPSVAIAFGVFIGSSVALYCLGKVIARQLDFDRKK
jgi:curved DNA-binding protein CbpA